ncbi:hypothetical protein [Algoriphagus litoralis]|uniref:hypothetical protein n=1 Tax=Algoriphagus litoralis TaxID=2202829 RepID=UPI000DB96B18|nr:hypothetical protein [Algoriphagus litoralis]
MRFKNYLILSVLVWLAWSCAPEGERKKLEKLPYFNLSGFFDVEIPKIAGATVIKTSRVNGEEKTVELVYSEENWKEEFAAFYDADINSPSLAQAYSTDTKYEYLIHELLPEAKGKVKEIKVRYAKDYPSSITFHSREENLFFFSSTIGEFHLNLATNKLDHYSIETTQKVWFLKPTNIKISGVIK